ncbi:TPA: GNAT family N-acetyltransferase [Streptococcus agalactiae]
MNKFFLESERLIIRPLEESDYDSWYTSFMNRGPSLTPFDDGILDMSMCDINWFKNLVNLQRKEWESDIVYIFGVFLKSGEYVGMLNIVTLARADMQWGELGYVFHNQFWSNGYAFESILALLNSTYEKLGFHHIEAQITPGNERSENLVRRLGLTYETTRKDFSFENGKWTDKLIYSINLHNNNLE